MYAKLKKKKKSANRKTGRVLPGRNVEQKVKRKVEGAARSGFGTADGSRFD